MNLPVTYAQFKALAALAGLTVSYMDNGAQFRAIATITGHPEVYLYDALTAPATWAVDFPLARLVDVIDLSP